MRVSLVFPPFHDEKPSMPPLGLLTLGTVLKDHGYPVQIMDFVLQCKTGQLIPDKSIYDRITEQILATRADVVGFSTQCVTYPSSINIAKRIKSRAPNTTVVFGGHNATFLDVETLENFAFLDYVVRGEGENTFLELLQILETSGDVGDIPGLTFRRGSKVIRNPNRHLHDDLDRLAVPDYSLIEPLQTYRDADGMGKTVALVEFGRGCVFACAFCSTTMLWNRMARTQSVPKFIEHIRYLKDDLGVESIYITYDLFTWNIDTVLEFCDAIEELGLEWRCRCRLDQVDRAVLQRMSDAGCVGLLYGFESGSPETLKFLRKRLNFSECYKTIETTAKLGIRPSVSFVMGFPEETREQLNMTLETALRCASIAEVKPFLHFVTVLPGTEIYDLYKDELTLDVVTSFSAGIEFDEGTRLAEDQELIVQYPGVFCSFYNLQPKHFPRQLLDDLSNYFAELAVLYHKTFFAFSTIANLGALDVFDYWRVNHRAPCENVSDSFFETVTELTDDLDQRDADLIQDVMELDHIIAGIRCLHPKGVPFEENSQQIDSNSIPSQNQYAVFKEFRFDISEVVQRLETASCKDLPYVPTGFVFSPRGKKVLLTRLSPFGEALYTLSDGQSTVAQISAEMSSLGEYKDEDRLNAACYTGFRKLLDDNAISIKALN